MLYVPKIPSSGFPSMSHCYFPIAFLTQAPAPFRMSLISMAFVADGICGMHSENIESSEAPRFYAASGICADTTDLERDVNSNRGSRGAESLRNISRYPDFFLINRENDACRPRHRICRFFSAFIQT
jgi:hypothetical protein